MTKITINFDDQIGEIEEDRIALLFGHVLKEKGNLHNEQTGNDIVFPLDDPENCTEFQWLKSIATIKDDIETRDDIREFVNNVANLENREHSILIEGIVEIAKELAKKYEINYEEK